MGVIGSTITGTILLENISRSSFYRFGTIISSWDIALVRNSWDTIILGEPTDNFLEERSKYSNWLHTSCLTWFFELFFGHFFELCPDVEPMFASVSIQCHGRLVCGVISYAIDTIQKRGSDLRSRLCTLVEKHYYKGVKSHHYGSMGSALLYALEKVLGATFDVECNRCWTLVYSHLLSIILPTAMKLEQLGKAPSGPIDSSHSRRINSFDDIPDQNVTSPNVFGYKDLNTSQGLYATKCPNAHMLIESRTLSANLSQSTSSHVSLTRKRTASYHGITYYY